MALKGNNRRNFRIRCLAAAMMLIFIAALVCLIFYYHATATKVFTLKGKGYGDGIRNITVTGGPTKSWAESGKFSTGAEYDWAIKNNSYGDIYGWKVTLDFDRDFDIDSSWNGEFTQNGYSISVLPMDYNSIVKTTEQQTFGFVLHSSGKAVMTGYTLTYMRHVKPQDSPFFWAIIVLMGTLAVVTVTSEINNVRYGRLQKSAQERQEILEQSFKTFAKIIDAKDPYTRGHSVRVAYYARELARDIGLNEEELQRIYYVGLLHDIGKIGVTDQILNKPGKLTDFERDVIQTHVEVGGEILKDFTSIAEISDGARYHHERWDGKGYAAHIGGPEIPYFARIICVADSYDAMSSARCYRGSLSKDQIIRELELCSGSQFDPDIVPHMLKLIRDGRAPIDVETYMKNCP